MEASLAAWVAALSWPLSVSACEAWPPFRAATSWRPRSITVWYLAYSAARVASSPGACGRALICATTAEVMAIAWSTLSNFCAFEVGLGNARWRVLPLWQMSLARATKAAFSDDVGPADGVPADAEGVVPV